MNQPNESLPLHLREAERLLHEGFHLVALHPLSKRPVGDDWNDPSRRVMQIAPEATGYGLPLALNKLCSIDPDHLEFARAGLKACGWNLGELMAAGVRTSSTRPNSGGRSTFLTDDRLSWVRFAIKVGGENVTVLELRADSANLQDCLPGVQYLDKQGAECSQQYAGDRRLDEATDLPESFANWWSKLSADGDFLHAEQAKFAAACGPGVGRVPSLPTKSGAALPFASPLRVPFNAAVRVGTILDRNGYLWDAKTQRYSPPSATGAAGVRLIPGRDGLWRSDHASDPLAGTFDAWVAFVVLEHGYDVQSAEAAAQAMGIEQRAAPTFEPERAWPEAREIKSELPPPPPFDADVLLPPVLAAYVKDESSRIPCPPEFVAASLVVALGAAIGSRCALRPKSFDNWLVVPNLWGGVVGDPSTKKTPGIAKGLTFLDALEAAEAKRLELLMAEHEAEVAAYEARKAAIQAEMKKSVGGEKSKGSEATADAVRRLSRLDPPKKPATRRFRTNDPTVEKIADILVESPAGILVVRDELNGLLASFEKSGREGDRAFYLEGWNGTSPYAVDRIGRGSQLVKRLTVGVFGGLQESVTARFLADAEQRNDGMLQRFQVMVFPDAVQWRWVNREPQHGVREAVSDLFKRLASFDPEQDGATRPHGSQQPPAFGFDSPAQELFIEWSGELYRETIANESSPLLRQHFAKYEKLFCALSLIFHLADGGVGQVPVDAALRAAAFTQFLEGHARRIYALAGMAQTSTARALARRIANGDLPDPFTAREIARKNWQGLDSQQRIETALSVLEGFGHIVGVEAPATERGGRPTVRYRINPAILGAAGQ